MRIATLSLAIGFLMAGTAWAADAVPSPASCEQVEVCGSPKTCGRCGHGGCCEKYCKVVPTTKEVKKTVWVVKCEDFCAPLPGCKSRCCDSCSKCGKNCDGKSCEACCGCKASCDPCAAEKAKEYVTPKCGKVRCKKTVEKREVTCTVPAFKCVVVYCCPECGGESKASPAADPAPAKTRPAPAPLPPPPAKTADVAPLPPAFSVR